jgi:hypothetical protein
MARQSHTPLTALGTKTDAYSANAADLTMTAADTVNSEQVTLTGNELVIAWNSNAGAQTVTVSSVVDDMGRDGDITTYSIGAGEYAVFGPFDTEGWRQSDGKLYFEASHADVKLGVVKLVR